ncbi:hypothetical protein Tco_0281752 [Tanacetum coccineum]
MVIENYQGDNDIYYQLLIAYKKLRKSCVQDQAPHVVKGHGGQDEEEEAWDFKKLKYEVNDHEEQSEIRQIRRHILFGDQT